TASAPRVQVYPLCPKDVVTIGTSQLIAVASFVLQPRGRQKIGFMKQFQVLASLLRSSSESAPKKSTIGKHFFNNCPTRSGPPTIRTRIPLGSVAERLRRNSINPSALGI